MFDIILNIFLGLTIVLIFVIQWWKSKSTREVIKILNNSKVTDYLDTVNYSDLLILRDGRFYLNKNQDAVAELKKLTGVNNLKFKRIAIQLIVLYYLEKTANTKSYINNGISNIND
ncbi:MAG: hypothetical protein K2Y14_01165 [Burkholderiales bacterium]|nr:hypothetical protein [Burkholderiales bacterium]